ncbi:MAG: ABC transporter permease [Chloroflexi bacterium]|nr:ABC transporter permease [Chloroflexota bacterium]
MIRRLASSNSVTITGVALGLVSLAFGWVTLKPNRLSAGTSLSLWEGAWWGWAIVLLALWLGCLVISLSSRGKWSAIVPGMMANLAALLPLVVAALGAEKLIASETPFARVSLGMGVWLGILGAYMVIFSARQRLRDSPLWQNLVSWSALAAATILVATGYFNNLSILQEFASREARFWQELQKHILLVAGSVAVGTLLGIPLGIWASRSRRAEAPVFFLANVTQTIPSLALFGLLIAPLSALSFAFPVLREFGVRGIGVTPAIIALVIYSLLPIVRNTFAGLRQIDPATIDAGRGMGMTSARIFRNLEVPLAAPLVLEGVRTASVQAVGNTAVAALIGAGGLGWFVFQGLGQAAPDLILLGVIPMIVLALLVDTGMRIAVRLSRPKGVGIGR